MCQTERSGYTNVAFAPSKYGVYLVKTKQCCYDFALFDINGWGKGKTTDGEPMYWMPIPQHD